MAADERTGDYMFFKVRIDGRCICWRRVEVLMLVTVMVGGDGLLEGVMVSVRSFGGIYISTEI